MKITNLKIRSAKLQHQPLVMGFEEVGIKDIPLVGGKNASLGEMIQQLSPKGIKIPIGFATTVYAYRHFLQQAGLETKLRQIFADLNIDNLDNLRQKGEQARNLILNTAFPIELEKAIANAYFNLGERYRLERQVSDRIKQDKLPVKP